MALDTADGHIGWFDRPAAALAIAMGALLAVVLRLRGSVPASPSPGGWRDLDDEALGTGTR